MFVAWSSMSLVSMLWVVVLFHHCKSSLDIIGHLTPETGSSLTAAMTTQG